MLRSALAVLLATILTVDPVVATAARDHQSAKRTARQMERLPGHTPPGLDGAIRAPSGPESDDAPITLTVVLNRRDQAGFERYLHSVYDPASPRYKKFLPAKEITSRFGPTERAYDAVLAYLKSKGFTLEHGSTNRLTLTVHGTRAAAEEAFDVRLSDYAIGSRQFTSNDDAPAVPRDLAPFIHAIVGLSTLAAPTHPAAESVSRLDSIGPQPNVRVTLSVCGLVGGTAGFGVAVDLTTAIIRVFLATATKLFLLVPYAQLICVGMWGAVGGSLATCQLMGMGNPAIWTTNPQCAEFAAYGFGALTLPPDGARAALVANPQTIGLLEFDGYHRSDVADWLAGFHAEDLLAKVTDVPVNGGVAVPGPNEAEVLLDLDTVLLLASLPGISYSVYHAPLGTSFQTMFNAMIDDGVTVISNSWTQCEDQTSLAEAQSIDAILQQAAAAGISVFNASGDSGSTCLNGSPNTIGVPANSPHATAVGGSSPQPGPGFTYGSEEWWDGTTDVPPTGQGGFGTSRHFTRPSYQDGFTASPMRSVPDVVANADPAQGIEICQASGGGCPSGRLYGGTSIAAPQWAAFAADLNVMLGSTLGEANPQLYALADTPAFHDATDLGSDFAHVGLGSPDLLQLRQQLSGVPAGAASTTQSLAIAAGTNPDDDTVPADGVSEGIVQVIVVDDNRTPLAGKTVTLTANAGSDAIITPPSVVTKADGTAVFAVTDLTVESVTFTATDTTDGFVVPGGPALTFAVPPAAGAGLNAAPPTVLADGVTAATITVTLQDALGRPTPGKLIALSQTGNSIVSGPNPPVTDQNGVVQFTAVDTANETVVYSAVDVTDGNLPFPATATVTFSNSPAPGCGSGTPPAAPGFVFEPYATGFVAQNLSFGGVNFGCWGTAGLAFDAAGNLFVSDFPTGHIYKFPPGGGVANQTTRLTTTPLGPSLAGLVFDPAGNLFASRDATTGNFTTGAVMQLDPSNGTVVRTIAPNLTCPTTITRDPLSGDIFATDSCFGAGSEDPAITRITDPSGPTPAVSTYATLPVSPNATVAFAANGTMYVWANTQIARVSGTNGPATPTVELLPGLGTGFIGLLAGGAQPNGDGEFVVLSRLVNGTATGLAVADLTTSPPSIATEMSTQSGFNFMTLGPDGCIYAAQFGAVYRVTDAAGGCGYASHFSDPALHLSPTTATPSPAQGTAQTFTATFQHLDVPEGTTVGFVVTGPNRQVGVAETDATGRASFTYVGAEQGRDTVTASAIVADTTYESNSAYVTWGAGDHVTFLTLNLSPTAGLPFQQTTVSATLLDTSVEPAAPLAGRTVELAVGGAQCSAVTDANGLASCSLTLGGAGLTTLMAFVSPAPGFLGASDQLGFLVGGGSELGHFLVSKVAPTKGSAKFVKIGPVTLADPTFGSSNYDVTKPTHLAVPASKNGGGIADAATHLEAYALKPAKGSAKFPKRADVAVANQCGGLTLTVAKPVAALVPTAADPSQPAGAPSDATHEVDHFLCYAAKTQKKRSDGTAVAGLAKGTQVDVADAITPQVVRRYDLKKVAWLCDPVAKSGTPSVLAGPAKGTPFPLTPAVVRHPGASLVCYTVAPAKKLIPQAGCGPADPTDKGTKIVPPQPKPVPFSGRFVANQLGAGQVDGKKPSLLCIPSSVALP